MFSRNNLSTIDNELTQGLLNIYDPNEAKSIALLLLEHLGYSSLDLIVKGTKTLSEDEIQFLDTALRRLQNHEPVQYILRYAYFSGMKFIINNSVLIPRQETEELVDLICKENKRSHSKILDIGTGSGCIALSLKKNIPEARVDALDNSKEVLDVAIQNSRNLNLNVHFHLHDVLNEAFLPDMYDIIVSNPPYVTEYEKHQIGRNVLDYEPYQALFVPNDSPLIFYECIIELARSHLNAGGKLYFEINEQFGNSIQSLLKEAGFHYVKILQDINDKDRIATGQWPS